MFSRKRDIPGFPRRGVLRDSIDTSLAERSPRDNRFVGRIGVKFLPMDADEYFMREALKEAAKAAREGEVPIGAVVVRGGRIVARGRNRPIRKNDPTAHAEIEAVRKACRKQENYRLAGVTLYSTVEPCAMCLGAVVHSRIERLVFGAFDPKAGAVSSIMAFPFEKTNHKVEVVAGVLDDECGRILKEFFRAKRQK